MNPTPALERLLLSTEALLGAARGPRQRTLEVQRRFEAPQALAAALDQAVRAGAGGALLSPSASTREALALAATPVPIWALLPNVPAYVRDSSEAGLIGAALKRVRGASPAALVRLGITGASHALGVLKGDFASMMPLLLELEAAALGPHPLEAVVVAAPITDLALAGRHQMFFAHLTRFVRARFRNRAGGPARAGFETHNLGHLLRRLREWGVKPDLVIGPVNPRGFLMKPSPGETLAELAVTEIPVLAKQIRAGGSVSLGDGARFARACGALGVVVDLADLEEIGSDLASLLPSLDGEPLAVGAG